MHFDDDLARADLRAVFTSGDAKDAGLGSSALERLLSRGLIERLGRGVYQRFDVDAIDLDLAEVAARSPRATVCLVSALALHGLVDEIPTGIDVALPRNLRHPDLAVPVRWHSFDAATFETGRVTPADPSAPAFYSAERSLVDAFRLRSEVGAEVALGALRTWLARPGSRPAALVELADRLPRARGPVRTALAYLA